MALVNCPICGKEVSDKASICVACGHSFEKNILENQTNSMKCPECGTENSLVSKVCVNCGYPLSINCQQTFPKVLKKGFKNKKAFGILLCVVLLVFGGMLVIKQQGERGYHAQMKETVNVMMTSLYETEDVGNLICDVWNNAIHDREAEHTARYTNEAKDFNEALTNLFSDEEIIQNIQEIRKKQKQIDANLGELRNPPSRYEEVYNQFKDFYYAYSDYTDFVISCSGSYNSYTEGFRNKEEVWLEAYRKIKVMLFD